MVKDKLMGVLKVKWHEALSVIQARKGASEFRTRFKLKPRLRKYQTRTKGTGSRQASIPSKQDDQDDLDLSDFEEAETDDWDDPRVTEGDLPTLDIDGISEYAIYESEDE